MNAVDSMPAVFVWWLPLGAGGWFVRLNGRIYEAVKAGREGRQRLDLYHTALEIHSEGRRYVIEDAWPIPDDFGAARGVVGEGPVFSRRVARARAFRYEVRCWRDGIIADARHAVESPQLVSSDLVQADRILDLVHEVPLLIWGRDEMRLGDMWNSNSVISWLLATSGIPASTVRPPAGGRAPGWRAGLEIANVAADVDRRAGRREIVKEMG